MSNRWPVALVVTCLLLGLDGLGQSREYRPVTYEMLQNPDPSDWLSWRRTLDGQGHSPLDQITTENINELRLAWSWSLGEGLSLIHI